MLFRSQLAATKQEQYEAFLVQSNDPVIKTWPAQKLTNLKNRYPKTLVATERDIAANEALRKQIKYFENIMRGGNRRSLDEAVQDNLAKQDQARERIAELESRQRAYEQQEAVRTGATPGTAEAQRLIEGEGYRTAAGATRRAPKKLSSWGITAITKKNATPVAPAKIAATSNMVRQYQKDTEAAQAEGTFKQQTLQIRLQKATANIQKLNNALQQVYPESVATATDKEITDLLAAGLSPEKRASLRDMAQVYANLKNSVAGNTVADVLARIQAEIDRLAKEPGRFAARRGESDKGLEETKTVSPAELISNLRHQYRIIQNQPKTADPWTSSFNALIQETNAKALLASQELDFATKLLASEERLLAQEQANIDAVKKEPYSGTTGVRMSNAEYKYDQQLERVQDANVEYGNKQAAYQIARLEQLNLLKAYGGDLQANINAEVEKIQTLTPQLEQQAKENAENKAQLQKANQALAKVRVEERKKAAETVPSQTAGLSYSAQEREALKRIREGLGLPGTRYETDTTSTLVVKTKAAIRQTLTLEQSKLDKAREADDVAKVQEQTLRVQELQQAFESVQDLGERVVTPVGEGAAERTVEREESGVLPGTRLPRRRVGPVARVGTQPPGQMLSGTAESREAISKGNQIGRAHV